MKRIVFLFPGSGASPSGGLKVICEYANYLAQNGYSVDIAYAGSLFWRKKSLYFKLTNIVRYVQHRMKGFSCRNWFPLDPRVREHFVFSLNERHVPVADRYIATSPYTAMYLNHYNIPSIRKYYFIQGYENWGAVTDLVLRETYHYQMQKIVISNWLARIMQEERQTCEIVPNGFDFNAFQLMIPLSEKKRYGVTMLYHPMKRKGCEYGFAALARVKKICPELRVSLFGVPERPNFLPDWYEYTSSPNRETLNRIYNENAIYLGCSSIEGWGLTIGEAMLCGSAIVCTDNSGYLEMAKDNETALVSPVNNAEKLADNLLRLLKDDPLRRKIAESGYNFIHKFDRESSCRQFRNALHLDSEL